MIEQLEPDRIGHGVKAAYDDRTMGMLRERGTVLEICPTSNLQTEVVSGWEEFRWIFDQFRRNGIRYAISTDGPEMLRTYIRDELATLGRLGILSLRGAAGRGRDVDGGLVRASRGRDPGRGGGSGHAPGSGARGGVSVPARACGLAVAAGSAYFARGSMR